ncbi:MAG: aminopeptidase P family protein [Bacteroidota bacterium]
MKRLPVILLVLFSQLSFAQWDDKDFLTPGFHQNRRDSLRALIPAGSVAILFANPVRNRANDVDYEYHQDPNFYYLTGYREPDALVVIFKEEQTFGAVKTNEILFVQQRNEKSEVWTGKRLGVEGAKSELKWKDVYNNSEFKFAELNLKILKQLLVIWPQDPNSSSDEKSDLLKLTDDLKAKINSSGIKENKDDLKIYMAGMREQKLPEEMVLLQKAIDISAEGFKAMMQTVKPGMKEYQTQATGEYVFKNLGAEGQGYGSICGGGKNACVLHYVFNRSEVEGDNMFLVDMGAEYHGYTADVTRTFPVDGRFSEAEKEIYQLVYDAQEAAFKACKVGNAFRSTHLAAYNVIAKGLIQLGIITKEEDAKKYFMHGTSHYLGLDVHDAGSFGPYKAGTVITVEPGIYIPEGSNCDKKYWNIGVRIEDDVLITPDGYKVLSGNLARSVTDIERLMAAPQ